MLRYAIDVRGTYNDKFNLDNVELCRPDRLHRATSSLCDPYHMGSLDMLGTLIIPG